MTRSLRWFACLAVLLVAGCARPGTGGSGDPMPGFGADELVLQAGFVGGFNPMASFAQIPMVSVYGDGRVITLGPQIDIYPSPALPNVQVTTISRSDVEKLWRRARDAGVGRKQDFGEPPIADAPSTRFRLRTADGLQVTEVYALREASPSTEGRRKLLALLTDLTDLRRTLGADAVPPERPYQATAIAGLAREYSADPNLPQPEVAWPGPELPGAPLAGGFGCVTAEGNAAQAVLTAAAEANALTPWTSAGQRFLVQLRPLLPDETGCVSLTTQTG